MFWWVVATCAAFFVKGLCGFTNGLVFTTILSFTTDNVNIFKNGIDCKQEVSENGYYYQTNDR